ncbi:MAG: hypothetical protein FJ280_12940 [Planctomycetes bacterium]|nr:hypothetical protein [Planctomycetota bacterium]
MVRMKIFAVFAMFLAAPGLWAGDGEEQLKVRISWGHTSPGATPFYVQVTAQEAKVAGIAGVELELDDRLHEAVCETHAGNGDVDGVEFTLRFAPVEVKTIAKVERIWADLIAQSDPDTVRRLTQDPAYRPATRRLTVQMDPDGTKGFSVTVDQLLQSRVFWVPGLDVYLTAGETAPSFAEHQRQLEAYKGRRVLDQTQQEPEATYEQFTSRWEDMGSPAYKHPTQPAPGHIVCLTWDSALYKFGIDRGAGVWNDYGSLDRFRFWFDFGDLSKGLHYFWKSQRLEDGLPIVTTTIVQSGVQYEVEQFAYPLHGPPPERRGDIPMVLLQKVTLTNRERTDGAAVLKFRQRREYGARDLAEVVWRQEGNTILFEENTSRRVLFAAQGSGFAITSCTTRDDVPQPRENKHWRDCEVVLTFGLARGVSKEVVLLLPSPPVELRDRSALLKLDYDSSRETTRKFWTDWLRRGAQFRVPEKVVNDLFRANLWHALRLPRRHGGSKEGAGRVAGVSPAVRGQDAPDTRIDLPYSNFAYDQRGAPWPVNQAVYVDYMIYGLRGYDDVAAEELLAMYRGNQEPNGHVKGYANWGVYTPAMIYTVARNYLLSGDRETFDKLLPPTLQALDWCLGEVRQARVAATLTTSSADGTPATLGLVRSPLNDLTGEGVWAFTQAYMYAAFDMLGRAFVQAGHPRAQECFEAAVSFRESIERAFGRAMMRSPLVPLRDGTWMPYVPCEATKPGRRFDQWYPTDVDTGAMHLLRLKALPARGLLAESLLHDHEDNLYLHGWGMANEPVYNPQATAYLLRDEPKAAIRAFYSCMACGFSQAMLEPVEHRWTWGQYFGPPSTDGAWFELYRNMLIHELDDGSLLLLQATPRQWLAEGKQIAVERAPTHYGAISLTVDSRAAAGSLTARIEMPGRRPMPRLLVRFRHPEAKPIRSVTVNGRDWTGFDVQKEWVVIDKPVEQRYVIAAEY